MAYRAFPLASQNQSMARASSARAEPQFETLPSLAGPGVEKTASPGIFASRRDDYTLPSGVASIEHWLDLNA